MLTSLPSDILACGSNASPRLTSMPRQKLIGVRLSAPEYDRLATAAAAAGAAPATLARRLLRDL